MEKIIEKMLICGFSSSESLHTKIGKEYVHFCETWVSEYELSNFYNTSVYLSQPDNELYLMHITDNYVFDNLPTIVPGETYTINNIQFMFLDKFVSGDDSYMENQFFFNRADLIKAGLIK